MLSHCVCTCMHTYVQFWMDNGLENCMSVAVVPLHTETETTCDMLVIFPLRFLWLVGSSIVSHTIWGIIIITYQLCHSAPYTTCTASIRLQSDSEGEYHSSKAGESDARSTLRTNIVVKYRTWPPSPCAIKVCRIFFYIIIILCWQSCLQQVFPNIDMTRHIYVSSRSPRSMGVTLVHIARWGYIIQKKICLHQNWAANGTESY